MINADMSLYEIRKLLSSGKTIYDLTLKVTYYARVSTDKYEQLSSLENQINYYEEKIKNNSNWTYITGYIDEGISGTSLKNRNSFIRMIKDAKLHKFDLILTKEISRFSRNTLDSIKFTRELLENNIGIFFECDNINTFMPDSELRLTIMASMAQEEVRKLSERVKFGFQRSIKNGHVLGNNAIWGYKKDNCKLVIDEQEAELIRKIYDMYVHGHLGMRAIGNKLSSLGYKTKNNNPFSANTIRGILTNPKYKGYYCGNKTRVVDYILKTKAKINTEDWLYYEDNASVPPIVSEEIWNEAQRIIMSRSNKCDKKVFTNRYPFSGKIFCKEHNTTFRRKISISSGITKKRKVSWVCGYYLKHGISYCNSPILYEDELKNLICKIINKYVSEKNEIIDELMNEYKSNYKDLDFNKNIEIKKEYINNIMNKKDVLLELRLNNQITDEEFKLKKDVYDLTLKEQNNLLNLMIFESDKYDLDLENITKLRDIIKKELIFDKNNSDELIYTLLDKIYISKINNNRNKCHLDIYLKLPILEDSIEARYTHTDYAYDSCRC